jgi:hypothetical protein
MSGLRLAGALWLMAAVVCTGLLIVVFLGENVRDLSALVRDPVPPLLVLAGAIVSWPLGVQLVRHPGPRVVRWSTIAGVGWLLVYGVWAIQAFNVVDDTGPRTSILMIIAFGVAAALVAWASRTQIAAAAAPSSGSQPV